MINLLMQSASYFFIQFESFQLISILHFEPTGAAEIFFLQSTLIITYFWDANV